MRGSSRAAFVAGHDALARAQGSGVDWSRLAEDLFGASTALDASASLRRAVADPSREGSAKARLVSRLFEGKVTPAAQSVLETLAAQRWAQERDVTDAVETLAVDTVLASAEAGGRLDSVEDELFRFERVVAGSPSLREVVSRRSNSDAERSAKADLVGSLLEGKAAPETVRLARQAVLHPRGRRFDRVIDAYLAVATRRREQLTATVTAAVPLDETQRQRLATALRGIYNKAIQINVIIDPSVVGGVRVQVGDEVVDGTVLSRLDEARRRMAG